LIKAGCPASAASLAGADDRDSIGQHVTPGTALLAPGIVYGDLGASPFTRFRPLQS